MIVVNINILYSETDDQKQWQEYRIDTIILDSYKYTHVCVCVYIHWHSVYTKHMQINPFLGYKEVSVNRN